MRIDYRDKNKNCFIWVPFSDKDTYKETSLYKSTVDINKSKGYNTCVYVGGMMPLSSIATDILDSVK